MAWLVCDDALVAAKATGARAGWGATVCLVLVVGGRGGKSGMRCEAPASLVECTP